MRSTPSPDLSQAATESARTLRGVVVALTVALLTLLAGCSTTSNGAPATDETPPPAFTETFTLGVGDVVRVAVWRNDELSLTVPVRPDGRISLPLVGDVVVGGRTPEAVAAQLSESLKQFVREPRVSVIVTSIGSSEYLSRVRVTGAVRQPRSLPFRPGMTVIDVVLDAGGPTEFADSNSARLYRGDGTSVAVDLDAILRRGDLRTNHRLGPGDVITIPESVF